MEVTRQRARDPSVGRHVDNIHLRYNEDLLHNSELGSASLYQSFLFRVMVRIIQRQSSLHGQATSKDGLISISMHIRYSQLTSAQVRKPRKQTIPYPFPEPM